MFIVILLISCREKTNNPELNSPIITNDSGDNKLSRNFPGPKIINREWQEITYDHSGILLDIRYATKNNFTKNQIYNCGKCFLRPEIAEKLIQLNRYIEKKHQIRFKVFDCYRPRPAQQKLWDIVPNPIYVTPPEKGSMHNRGMAVDLTITDLEGKELNMGTEYDYFGREAHTDFTGHSATINNNRAMLTELMKSIGFNTIQSEWWHFSMRTPMYPLSDWEWPCD